MNRTLTVAISNLTFGSHKSTKQTKKNDHNHGTCKHFRVSATSGIAHANATLNGANSIVSLSFLPLSPSRSFILLVLTTAGWISAIIATSNCSFIEVYVPGTAGRYTAVGLFKYAAQDGSCIKYPPETNFTTFWYLGRAFGVLASMLSGTAVVLLITSLFFVPQKPIMWNSVRWLVSLSATTQGLTLMTLFGIGRAIRTAGFASYVALGILVVASIQSCFCTRVPQECVFGECLAAAQSKEEDTKHGRTKHIMTVIDANGNKTRTETVTDAKGNKTVTRTIELNEIVKGEEVELGTECDNV